MVKNILDHGKIIKCMEKTENFHGQMEEFISEIISKIKNMGMEKYNGQMERCIKVNGIKEFNMDLV
jgi:hypothetical protein